MNTHTDGMQDSTPHEANTHDTVADISAPEGSSIPRGAFLRTAAAGVAAVTAGAAALPARAATRVAAPMLMRTGSQVTLSYLIQASAAELKVRQKIANAFMAANPDIKIAFQSGGSNFQQKLTTEIAGGTPPDLIMSFELQHAIYSQQGSFMNLDPFISADSAFQHTVMSQEYPAMLDMFSYKGHLYAMPEAVNNVVLYYNRDHMAAAGLTMPTSWDDKTWTWDTFVSYAKKLTQKRGNRTTNYGFAECWWWPLNASSVIAPANGGDWFKKPVAPAAGSSNLTDPKIERAIQFYADLTNVYKVAPANQDLQATQGFQMFMNGKASMGILGHWFFQDFAAVSGLHFDIAPIPMGPDAPGHSATALGGIGLAISSKTKYPEQAWRFVKYWTGLTGQQGFAASGLWVPTLRNIGQSAQYKAANSAAPHATLFTDVLAKGYVHSLPITQAWGQLSTPWANTLIDRIWSGKQSAGAALPALNATVNADIRKYG